ncbi:MAG TPA: YARHG domain-containing protein [Mucilaginibacter sp.]
MKTKTLIRVVAFIMMAFATLFIVRCKTQQKAQHPEISAFLNKFNKQIQARNVDSLMNYFEDGRQTQSFTYLAFYLTGGKTNKDKDKPLVSVSLDVDGATIKTLNDNLSVATVPVKLSHDSVADKQTILTFTIHKLLPGSYKISAIDGQAFLKSYLAYENAVKARFPYVEQVTYSPGTLEAFKIAATLKPKYDSVVWFAHFNNKPYFYVIKGKWDESTGIGRNADSAAVAPYKMGLVGPDLKEIIPPEYDLVHNINATFPGLVEVEKDNKKGFYDLSGKIVLPVSYDQIFPVNDDSNLAVLRTGDDYFYLKQDMTISDKADIKIGDILPKIKGIYASADLYYNAIAVVTEFNSKTRHGAIYIAPSYLVDLNLIGQVEEFKNPLRKTEFEDVHTSYKLKYANTATEPNNWLQATFYSIRDYFIGGRGEFYDHKNMVIADKKNNRIYTQEIGIDYTPGEGGGEALTGVCDVNSIKVINDTLYEVKTGATIYVGLYDSAKYISGGPYYHYYVVKNNKLKELPNNRTFGFTKYIKMDDSYLNACYVMTTGTENWKNRQKRTLNQITPEMLHYMKNEIFADYAYKFKDKRWQDIFSEMDWYSYKGGEERKSFNTSIDDSLTVIDKYNINWINQKIKAAGTKPATTLAAK